MAFDPVTLGAAVQLAKDPATIKASVEDWLGDHPEATTTVEDGSITKAKLHDDLADEIDQNTADVGVLKSAIETLTGNTEIQFSDPALKQYINTNKNVGEVVSWDTPSVSGSTNTKWAAVSCVSGNKFVINGKGGSSDRLWAWLDSDKKLLSKSNANATGTNLEITAPASAAYLVINDEQNKQSFYNSLIRNEISGLETADAELLGKMVRLNKASSFTTSNVAAPYDDLDTFPENEIAYYVQGNAASHSPTTGAFQIMCIRTYNHATRVNQGKQQIVITFDGNMYFRSCDTTNQVWSEWTTYCKLSQTIYCDKRSIQSSTIVVPYDDLNTIPENTILYYLGNSGVQNNPFTASTPFQVMTIRTYNSANYPNVGKVQIAYGLNSGSQEIRVRTYPLDSVGWTSWRSIETKRLDYITPCYTDYLPSKYNIDSNSKLLFSGDSITYGVTSDAPYDHSHGYVNLILDKFGCSGSNMGVSGASYADTGATTILQQLQTAVSQSKLTGDYLFVFAGTNDYGGGASLSDLRDALDDTYDYIDQNYTGVVTIILPIGRSATPPRANKPLDDYVQTIFEKAIERGYNILNGMSFGFPTDGTTPSYTTAVMSDGTHPTILGHQILANKILKYIDTNSAIQNASGVSF